MAEKDAGGSTVTKDEERLRHFLPSLLQCIMARPVVLWVHISRERDGKQKEDLIIQVEMVNELLQHLDTEQSMGQVGSTTHCHCGSQ